MSLNHGMVSSSSVVYFWSGRTGTKGLGQVRTQISDEMEDMELITSSSDFDICTIGQFLNLDDCDNGMVFSTFLDAEK
jgi:hypothetical protein